MLKLKEIQWNALSQCYCYIQPNDHGMQGCCRPETHWRSSALFENWQQAITELEKSIQTQNTEDPARTMVYAGEQRRLNGDLEQAKMWSICPVSKQRKQHESGGINRCHLGWCRDIYRWQYHWSLEAVCCRPSLLIVCAWFQPVLSPSKDSSPDAAAIMKASLEVW